MIPVEIENVRVKLALANPIGAPIEVANEKLPVLTDKTINDLSK